MNAEEWVFEKYASVGRRAGKELLLGHADSLRLLEDCMQLQLMIIGIDFYEQKENDIIELPISADYSSLYSDDSAVEKSIVAARKLMKDRLPNGATWASFTIEDRRDKAREKQRTETKSSL